MEVVENKTFLKQVLNVQQQEALFEELFEDVNGYILSYKLPVIIVRANNIFGTRQHPEKLIAGCCWSFIKKKSLQYMEKDFKKELFYT